MSITLDAELEAALAAAAKHRGLSAEELARAALRERFVRALEFVPRDEWERKLIELGSDCGTSISNESLSREEMYV